jgi:hypothetical protein
LIFNKEETMTRVLVEAVAHDYKETFNMPDLLTFCISVSQTQDGSPITQLAKSNFTITGLAGGIISPTLYDFFEDKVSPGFYTLQIEQFGTKKLPKGTHIFGISVKRTERTDSNGGFEQGQTIVSVQIG